MNEVRRYDFKHAGPDNGIYYADARMIPCSIGKYVLSPDYDALVARVQAMKQERDVMSNSREALVEVVKELRQQLAEAQGRVLEVGELNVKLRDAEQQVVRLRTKLKGLGYEDETLY